MKRNIAIAVSLVVVFGFFYKDFINQVFAPNEAWASFQGYLGAARDHDLEALSKFSYRLSPACQDQSRRQECEGLMSGIYDVAKDFKREDFKYVETNERGVILYTDYMGEEENALRVILSFGKKEGGLKLAGVKFCFSKEADQQCRQEAFSSF
ncbi:MAG TPA: hypothetical protein VJJ48_01840 [Candidatus Paceibacterota bacterium]